MSKSIKPQKESVLEHIKTVEDFTHFLKVMDNSNFEKITLNFFKIIYKQLKSEMLLKFWVKKMINLQQTEPLLFLVDEGKIETYSLYKNLFETWINAQHTPEKIIKSTESFIEKSNYKIDNDKELLKTCIDLQERQQKVSIKIIDFFLQNKMPFDEELIEKAYSHEIKKWLILHQKKILEEQTTQNQGIKVKIL